MSNSCLRQHLNIMVDVKEDELFKSEADIVLLWTEREFDKVIRKSFSKKTDKENI